MAVHIDITPASDVETLAKAIGHTSDTVSSLQTRTAGSQYIPTGTDTGIVIGSQAGDKGIAVKGADGKLQPLIDEAAINQRLAENQTAVDAARQDAKTAMIRAQTAVSSADKAQEDVVAAQRQADQAAADATTAKGGALDALKAANSAIANASHIYRQAAQPTGHLHQSDLWIQLGADGKVIGLKTYSSDGQWYPVTLEASRIIVPGSIGAVLIEDGAVTAPKIKAGAVESDKIAAGAVDAKAIAAGAVDAEKISAGTITGDKIAADTIDAANLAAGSVTGDKIAANAIDGKTITGATIRSSSGRLVINDSGITGSDPYGNQTFRYDSSNGTVQLTSSARIGSTTAGQIQSDAEDAQYTANSAQSTANTAQSTANDAQSTANQLKTYIYQDYDGIHVGNSSDVQAVVSPGSFDIKGSDGTDYTSLEKNVIAIPTYGDDGEYIGRSTIVFGTGGISITTKATDGTTPYTLKLGSGGLGISFLQGELNIGSDGVSITKFKSQYDHTPSAGMQIGSGGLGIQWNQGAHHLDGHMDGSLYLDHKKIG